MSKDSSNNVVSSELLKPFIASREERASQIHRTSSLYSAATACASSSIPIQWKDTVTNEWFQIRPLTQKEVQSLEENNCRCKNWSKITLLFSRQDETTDWSNVLKHQISDSTFGGYVTLGVSSDKDPKKQDEGKIEGVRKNGMIYNSILEPNCVLYDNTSVSNAHVHSDASILHCGILAWNGDNKKWKGEVGMTLGPESGGGRNITVQVENTLMDVCRDLGMSSSGKSTPPEAMTIPMNIISSNSYIHSTPSLQCIYLSPHSYINAAASVSHSILLPHSSISNACTVKQTILQWNASITSSSFVEESLLMEEAHVGPSSSLISNTVLGPDVHVSAGEVHASILGPNTNAHHQSLLIGVLWPLGRGNVGYGSNVGSNHTGRLPDQENVAAEGTFWGLSSVIKFPLDLSYSPYSIVAAGVSLDSQRITMPFSLILSGANGNEIVPGWVLHASPYTIVRSETKFQQRRKAKRHAFYTGWRIIRPSVVNLCVVARRHLLQQDEEKKKKVVGVGNNILSERSRLVGIQAYTDMIQLYALRGFLDQIKVHTSGGGDVKAKIGSWLSREFISSPSNGTESDMLSNMASRMASASWPTLPWEEEETQTQDGLWQHQRTILQKELPLLLPKNSTKASSSSSDLLLLKALLSKLVQLEQNFAARVHKSKHRDDIRGKKIVPGYENCHVKASDDPVVIAVQKEAKVLKRDVVDILRMFSLSLEVSGDEASRRNRSRL